MAEKTQYKEHIEKQDTYTAPKNSQAPRDNPDKYRLLTSTKLPGGTEVNVYWARDCTPEDRAATRRDINNVVNQFLESKGLGRYKANIKFPTPEQIEADLKTL